MTGLEPKAVRIFLRKNFWQAFQSIRQPLTGGTIRQRFAIIANRRTGSNYLYEGLNSLPNTRMYHEIFAPHYRKPATTFQSRFSVMHLRQPTLVDTIGVKVFYSHLTTGEWAVLHEHRDIKYLHLTRKNRLRILISEALAEVTGQWTDTGRAASGVKPRIRLDEDRLLGQLNELAQSERSFLQRFSDMEVLELSYEELTASPVAAFSRVSEFLSLGAIDPNMIALKKQNPQAINGLIENYEEVARLLRDTEHEGYLA